MLKSIPKFETVRDREDYLRDNFVPYLGEELVEELIVDGFCSAPASTKYHGAYSGGLFDHTLAVVGALQDMTTKLSLDWERPSSPVIVGILHDLCKIDSYSSTPEGAFTWNNDPIVKGHGEKSVMYALQYGCKLTEEEIACILYHMGAYEKDKWDAYDNAIKRYPNVLFTHTADMYASKVMGV